MPSTSRTALRALLAVLTTACGGHVRPDELPGTYVMNHGHAADTLVVRAGGTYVRRYAAPGRPAVVDSGQWSIEVVTGEGRVAFDGFPARWQTETFPSRRDTPRGLWAVPAGRSVQGTVRLPVNEDLGWAYVRVAGP